MLSKFAKWLYAAIALVVICVAVEAQQTVIWYQGLHGYQFSSVTNDVGVRNIGSGIAYHLLTWTKSGTVSVCTVQVDSSTDNVSWSSGDVISSQDCSTNGQSTIANDTVNYIRIHPLTFTGTGSVTAVWTGYVTNPSGGGGSGTVTSIATTAPIGGGTITSTGTLTCATCLVATVNPTAGLLRVAGSTQTAAGAELSGDCTTSGSNAVTCTKTNSTAFTTLATTAPGTGVATALGVNTGSAGAFGVLIASGTAAMNTSAVSSGACETVVTVSATGVATTDAIIAGFNTDPTGITGYGASASGAVLTIYPYPTSGNVNFKVCNSSSGSITPGSLTLNWRVIR